MFVVLFKMSASSSVASSILGGDSLISSSVTLLVFSVNLLFTPFSSSCSLAGLTTHSNATSFDKGVSSMTRGAIVGLIFLFFCVSVSTVVSTKVSSITKSVVSEGDDGSYS